MEWLREHLVAFVLGVVVSLLCVAVYNIASAHLEPESVQIVLDGGETNSGDTIVLVHVVGAVAQPGVYSLPVESRVVDAVELAGGFQSDADRQAVNLAAHVVDAQQIHVPRISEQAPATSPSESVSGPLDLNTVSEEQLEELPGIGPVTAADIVRYRADVGTFGSCEELLEVPGIGEVTFSRIKDLVTVY